MIVVFLDDDEQRQRLMLSHCPCTKQVWDAQECMDVVRILEHIDVLFLDHDLGGEVFVDSDQPNTGAEVARQLASDPHPSIDLIVIHSYNPVGACNMYHLLEGCYRRVTRKPFASEGFKEIVNSISFTNTY